MTMEEICIKVNSLINASKGHPIELESGVRYSFENQEEYTLKDISNFEDFHNLKVPCDYLYFLLNVGAPKLYMDEHETGLVFIKLLELEYWCSQVFLNRDNPFPTLLPIAFLTVTGETLGYNLRDKNNITLHTYLPDEDPETWLDDTEYSSTLNVYLERLITSGGEETLI